MSFLGKPQLGVFHEGVAQEGLKIGLVWGESRVTSIGAVGLKLSGGLGVPGFELGLGFGLGK